jgi:glycosyltransferase involved in cell wall biosynthesis
MGLTWSILIPTHSSRLLKFARMVEMLTPQLTKDTEVVVYWNRGSKTIGEYRQALLEEARGTYVSFVDDDDRIAEDYCKRILKALKSGPDYVGFQLLYTHMSRQRPRGFEIDVSHSLTHRGWYQEGGALYRDVTHLNPIRRDIAMQVPFNGGPGEDRRWATQVRRLLDSEVYIDDVMYFYDFNRASSHKVRLPRTHDPRPDLEPPFRFHPDSDTTATPVRAASTRRR